MRVRRVGPASSRAPAHQGQELVGRRSQARWSHPTDSVTKTPMPISLPPIPNLVLALQRLIDQVPEGRVTTPGRLALALGNPVAARWIGHYLLHHDHDADCGCHRVVRAGGSPGPYPQGGDEKVRRLRAEGVETVGETIDLARYDFADFTSDRPLEKLARFQNRLAKKVPVATAAQGPAMRRRRRCFLQQPWRRRGGIRPGGRGDGRTALVDHHSPAGLLSIYYVVFDFSRIAAAGRTHRRGSRRRSDRAGGPGRRHRHSPSAPGGHRQPLGRRRRLADDRRDEETPLRTGGHRRLAALGIAAGLFEDQPIGVAIRPTSGSRRPLFISPGSGLDLASAEQIVRAVLSVRRLPLPLYWADKLSRRHAKNL